MIYPQDKVIRSFNNWSQAPCSENERVSTRLIRFLTNFVGWLGIRPLDQVIYPLYEQARMVHRLQCLTWLVERTKEQTTKTMFPALKRQCSCRLSGSCESRASEAEGAGLLDSRVQTITVVQLLHASHPGIESLTPLRLLYKTTEIKACTSNNYL